MARLTRHEILKEDHFLLAVEKTRDFFLARKKEILISAGAAVFVIFSVLGFRYFLAGEDEHSKDALSQALKTYHAPLAGSPEAASSDLTFPSLNQKLEKALAEFRDVSSRYSSRSAGKIAKYYAGLCLIDLKNTNEAIKELEPLSKEKSDYGALALVALAGLYENSGNLAKSADVYQKLAANDSSVSPKDMSLMHLAQLYEQQNKAADAIKTYQQVVKEFPGSSSSTDAEQKLKQLSQ